MRWPFSSRASVLFEIPVRAAASSTAVLFGAYEQTSGTAFVLSIPEIALELSLGIYLIVKRFRVSARRRADGDGEPSHHADHERT